jgi:hypothetical protein
MMALNSVHWVQIFFSKYGFYYLAKRTAYPAPRESVWELAEGTHVCGKVSPVSLR